MTLTPEQARQCRADFEEWADNNDLNTDRVSYLFADSDYYSDGTRQLWDCWQAAWRPRPSVERMVKIMLDYFDAEEVAVIDAAQAIHALQGGEKDE